MNTAVKKYPEVEPTLHDVISLMKTGLTRIDERFDDMDARFDLLTLDVRDVQQRMGRMELHFEDLADTVLNHEERLVKLEIER
jgi:hypothetical protein